MSMDMKKVLVKDDRLNVSDSIGYAVHKGSQQMTPAQYNVTGTPNTSSHVFNIQIPSETTLVDRRVLWQSQLTLQISGTAPAGQFLVNYGLTDSLSAFPLHQACNVMTSTINNNSVSINIADVLPAILRFNDKRELSKYNGLCPVAFDTYGNYADAVGAINNPLGGFNNCADNDLLSRGAWVVDQIYQYGAAGTATSGTKQAPTVSTGVLQYCFVQFTCTEPLLLSPFIFSNPQSNCQAFYGIQNLNMIFNINNNLNNRIWRSSGAIADKACTIASWESSRLLFNFLTGHPSDLLPSRNVVGYYELPRYITAVSPGALTAQTSAQSASATRITSSNIQLNQIPDKMIVFVRQNIGTQKVSTPDAWLCIKGISINFNNAAGILSSATQQDLFRYSVENGSNQSFQEFSGLANVSNLSTGAGKLIPTSGSMLILDFGKDINLTEDYYASGSLGNFQLQFNLDVYNTNPSLNAVTTYELVLITMNSGLWVNERGTSSCYTGILTKQDVLDASQMEPYFKKDVERLVGGGWFDTLKSVVGKVLPHLTPYAKKYLRKQGDLGEMGAKVIESLGYGRSGGKLADRLMK
jgi:hypothetical protein